MTEAKLDGKKPKPTSSFAEKELDKVQAQFDKYDDKIKELTMDRMALAPKEETEMQVKMSTREQQAAKAIYLKPHKSIGTSQKFNEKFREQYQFDKEYVHFIAENKECKGETIDMWTRPYGGMPAEEWLVPVNKPVWAPRYVAEQIRRKSYHRLVMQENKVIHSDFIGETYGQMVADTTIERLTARPVSDKKSVFMGASGF